MRVRMPVHLRTLARVDGAEVAVDVPDTPTIADVLDAVERDYPALRGTIRDHGGGRRRALVRFYACGEDLSHEPHDTRLPDRVVSGDEPFTVIGAIAGG